MPGKCDTREGPARFEIRDLRGMSPTEMRLARVEFHARATELHEGPGGEGLRDKTDAESREFKHCLALIDAIDAHLAWDSEVHGTLARHPRSLVRAGELETRGESRRFGRGPEFMASRSPWHDMHEIFGMGDDQVRDAALGALEERGTDLGLRPEQLDQADALMRSVLSAENPNCDGSYIARRALITESPAYRSAFRQLMTDPRPLLTSEEVEAVRALKALEAREFRAMSEGTTTAGGFGVPVFIDPSIILTSGAGRCRCWTCAGSRGSRRWHGGA
jgi:hypothetical protein